MYKIKILIKDITLDAELFDTKTARAIAHVLPVQSVAKRWGEEFYFEIPVEMPLDQDATSKVRVGDIGYWPPGNALAIFFGPTPISEGPDPVPASEVNLVGRITGDASILRKVRGAPSITIKEL